LGLHVQQQQNGGGSAAGSQHRDRIGLTAGLAVFELFDEQRPLTGGTVRLTIVP
jgi:hypothetical protein